MYCLNEEVKVSVVIPVYNVELYLRECLESVVHQTLREIEIICVNDGSNDGSPAILEEYEKRDKRITVINQENGGLSAARNAGLDCARGKYIYFLDSDDYIQLSALEELCCSAQKNELDIFYFGMNRLFEDEEIRRQNPAWDNSEPYHPSESLSNRVMSGEAMFQCMLEDGHYNCCVPFQFIRLELLKRTGLRFRTGIIHEDELFSPLLLLRADRVACTTDRFYMRRIRAGSIMTVRVGTKHFEGYFVSAINLLAEVLIQNENSPIGNRALLRCSKVLYNASIREYRKLSKEERAQIEGNLPAGYEFLFRALKDSFLSTALQNELRKEITNIHHSWSYRIGRFVTFVPRKVRGAIRCYKEHGARYTLRRVKEKTTALLGR